MSIVVPIALLLLAILVIVQAVRQPKRPETNAERREREWYQ
jgi:hypothetical protein